MCCAAVLRSIALQNMMTGNAYRMEICGSKDLSHCSRATLLTVSSDPKFGLFIYKLKPPYTAHSAFILSSAVAPCKRLIWTLEKSCPLMSEIGDVT